MHACTLVRIIFVTVYIFLQYEQENYFFVNRDHNLVMKQFKATSDIVFRKKIENFENCGNYRTPFFLFQNYRCKRVNAIFRYFFKLLMQY